MAMATDSLIAVNQQILKAIDGMIKSLKHIEESELKVVNLDIEEIKQLEEYAIKHEEYLKTHPQYIKLLELSKNSDLTKQNRRLLAVRLIRQEYGPLLELRKLVEDELTEKDSAADIQGEKDELAKDFEFEVKDHKGPDGAPTQLELTMTPTNTKYYFAEFRNEAERAKFELYLIYNGKNTIALKRFIRRYFVEKKDTQTNNNITTTRYYLVGTGDMKQTYGDMVYYQNKYGDVPLDFAKWVDKSKLEAFATKHLNKVLPQQQKTLDAIKQDAQAIQLAEQRVAEQLEQEKGLKDAVEKKLKVEAKEFDEIHGGIIPKKYKNLVKELSSPKYLHNVIERARNSPDDKFKDKPVEVLKQDIDQKIPQDQIELKGLLLKELVPKLEKELNVLATRKPAKLVEDTLKDTVEEFRKLAAAVTSLGAYNDNNDAKALKKKIDYVRNLIISSPLTRQERLKAAGFFNVRIVKVMVEFYKKENFTEDGVRKQIPALRKITTEELSKYK